MSKTELIEFLERKVEVHIDDGRIIEGYFTDIESDLDTISGEYEAEIMTPDYCVGIPIDTISNMKAI